MIRLDNVTQEDWFAIWLDELIVKGYVHSYKRNTDISPFPITSEVKVPYLKELKTKTKELTYKLLNGSSYTPDFRIKWNEQAIGKYVDRIYAENGHPSYFLCDTMRKISYVDVKSPVPGLNSSDVSFSLNRKVIFEKYGIFINKAVLAAVSKKKPTKLHLYHMCGAPERYFYTDKTMVPRTGAKKYKSIQEKIDEENRT